jgi:undecaprenyl-diphosphatase
MALWLKAVVLGIVEGVTEFLPVSSTGHLILVNKLLSFTGPFAEQFDIVIQLGAIFAVVIYFFKRLWPFSPGNTSTQRSAIMNLWYRVAVAVVPALVIGATLGDLIHEHLFSPKTVALALIVGGILLIVIDRRTRTSRIQDVAQITYAMAIGIGLFQCLGMIPGTSRSAATIIGAILIGCSRTAAAEFSFFLAVPTLAAASAYTLLKMFKTGFVMSGTEVVALLIGFLVSFVVAWAVIAVFMNYIRTKSFVPFGWYRIALGIVVLVWLGIGR